MGKRKTEDIFNECYERIRQGESIESCLVEYPKEAAKLEPLLRLACRVQNRAEAIQPRPELEEQMLTRLEGAWLYQQRQFQLRKKTGFNWQRGWALALTVVLVVIVVSGGTVAGSTQALPEEPLYPVKLAVEQATLALTFSDVDKAKGYAELAEKRALEISEVAKLGKTDTIDKVAAQLDINLEKANYNDMIEVPEDNGSPDVPTPQPEPNTFTAPPLLPTPTATAITVIPPTDKTKEFKKFLEESATRSIAVMEEALKEAPEQSKPALQRALEKAKKSYEKAIGGEQGSNKDNDKDKKGKENASGGKEDGSKGEATGKVEKEGQDK